MTHKLSFLAVPAEKRSRDFVPRRWNKIFGSSVGLAPCCRLFRLSENALKFTPDGGTIRFAMSQIFGSSASIYWYRAISSAARAWMTPLRHASASRHATVDAGLHLGFDRCRRAARGRTSGIVS